MNSPETPNQFFDSSDTAPEVAPELDRLDELADEYVARKQRGDNPSISEYCRSYPELKDEILELFPMLAMLEAAKPAGQAEPGQVPGSMGGYQIVRELGRGGMGVVYEAYHENLGRHVALKLLSQRLAGDGRARARFEREARAVAQLHHTNIIPLFEVGEDKGHVFLAMQLIQGRSLDRIIAQCRSESGSLSDKLRGATTTVADRRPDPNPPPMGHAGSTLEITSSSFTSGSGHKARGSYQIVARIGMQVAEALSYAHQRGVIHRDIKPSNLILDQNSTVWVTDFGLAKIEDEGLTQTGDVLGTLRYMPPERFQGDCDERSDVYSLGITLAELLTLRPIFETADRLKLIDQINHSRAIRLRDRDPSIPRDLETIVLKAMEREPADRYASAEAFAADLRRFLQDQPIQARRATIGEQAIRWGRRNRALASALATSLLLAIALVVGSLSAAFYFEAERDQANAERNRAVVAEKLAESRLQRLEIQKNRAIEAEKLSQKRQEIAQAFNDFITEDLLRQASPLANPNRELTVAEVLDLAAEGVEHRFPDKPIAQASLRRMIGSTYSALGKFQLAEQHLRIALDISREHLGHDSLETLQVMLDYAGVLQDLDRIAKSRELLEEVAARAEANYGQQSNEYISARNGLAGSYRDEDPVRAEELFRQVYELAQQTHGPRNGKTLIFQTNLGTACQAIGKHQEAEQLLREAWAAKQEVLGIDHPNTLTAKNNLATLLLNLEQVEESSRLLRELLPAVKRVMGPSHTMTLSVTGNLGAIYYRQRQYQDALPLLQFSFEQRKQLLGADHPDTLGAQSNLALAHQRMGRLEIAETLMVDCMRRTIRRNGIEHPATQTIQANLGMVYLAQNRWEEAEAVLLPALTTGEKIFGNSAKPTHLAREGLRFLYQNRSREAAQGKLWDKAVEDHLSLVALPETPTKIWYQGAPWFLRAGRIADYARLRDRLFKTYAEFPTPQEALLAAELALLQPLEDPALNQRVADCIKLSLSSEDEVLLNQARLLQARLAYREGRLDDATQWLAQVQWNRRSNNLRLGRDALRIAIDYQQGNMQQAREALDTLKQEADQIQFLKQPLNAPWQILDLLLEEVESLVISGKI